MRTRCPVCGTRYPTLQARRAGACAQCHQRRPAREAQRRCAAEDCGKAFAPVRTDQRFCSASCRNRDWRLKHPRRPFEQERQQKETS